MALAGFGIRQSPIAAAQQGQGVTGLTDQYRKRVKSGAVASDPAQLAVLPEFDRIARALTRPQRRGLLRKPAEPAVQGLYLWGGVGTGKSMLMDLFVDAVDVPRRRVHFHAFMQEVQEALHEARKEGIADALKPFLDRVGGELRLLAFDEMQITDIADAMIVGRLFEGLTDRGVTIVTTSNRPPADLYLNGLNRQLFLPFIDILNDRFRVRELASGKDYRQSRLAGAQVYFTPANAAARSGIDSIWHDLSGGHATELVLKVKGREVTLPAYGNGAARARFFDLCGRPLGPADYLALASHLRALILEEIPTLSRSNFNEAKRFVTLIDAIYEARVRLICSAAAEPEMLYLEGEGTFEFRRTASRLREMQGAGWGS